MKDLFEEEGIKLGDDWYEKPAEEDWDEEPDEEASPPAPAGRKPFAMAELWKNSGLQVNGPLF